MKKKFYETPHTQHVEVEMEGSFCASVVDTDKEVESTISIQKQGVGAESNYFDNPNGGNEWDF
ncbi:hypothetical protein [uncultured Bacteroides sp.]|uniref:hypothetical protein n=1 Tax=uncultured Bacteroides sp. TaxID=162156 RepID=UPI00260A21FC|nr:hypothetical protein [uncultured Bacteroides sp.]